MKKDTTWRLIVDRNSYADFSVSVSPAVEKAVVNGDAPPTVFLNIFDADSITVGVNEDPEQVLDLEFCRGNEIDFRRRVNGGGATWGGKGSAFLVFYIPTGHPAAHDTAAEAFPAVLTAVAETLTDSYGIPAAYRPLNDVEVEGRKLIPSSLKIEDGVMTFRIILNVKPIDTDFAGKAMPMPPEKTQDKALKDLTSRFTCLENEIERDVTEEELVGFAQAVAAHAFGEEDLAAGTLGEAEQRYAGEFRAELDTDDWLYGKSERVRFRPLLMKGDKIGRGRVKAVGGMLWAALAIRDGKVLHAVLNGDWHPRPIDSVARLEQALVGADAHEDAIRENITAFLADPDVEFASVEIDDLARAFALALESAA